MEGRQPSCAEIFSTKRKYPKPGKRNTIDYLVCNNTPTLLWLINLGCIDINPWSSTTSDPQHPDYIVIDLDPSDEDFKKAITTALAAKELFDKHKVKTFLKTSGKTGIHIVIPCRDFKFGEGKTKGEARIIAENICSQIHELVPEITTLNVSINSRGNKLYIDPSQNDIADTIASAYSCRPFHIPTVSTPLQWKEVKSTLDPHEFTIKTTLKRLEKKGDLWAGLYDQKIVTANSKPLTGFL
jgi:bifunctional non-homologous end joining protein LigD